jgi:hypothetical protein
MRQHQARSVPQVDGLLSCANSPLARAAPPGERPLVNEDLTDAHGRIVRAGSSTGQSAGLIIREVQGSSPCRPTEGEIHGTETGPANTLPGPLTQRQSTVLLSREFRVRPPGGPPASAISSEERAVGFYPACRGFESLMACVNGPRLKTGPVGTRTLIRRSDKPPEYGPLEESANSSGPQPEDCGFKPRTDHASPGTQSAGHKSGRSRMLASVSGSACLPRMPPSANG